MKIVITGGSGFIGSHVAESLKKQHDVSIFDLNEPKTEGVEFVKGDILDLELVKKSCASSNSVIPRKLFRGASFPARVYLPANGMKYFGLVDLIVFKFVDKIAFLLRSIVFSFSLCV